MIMFVVEKIDFEGGEMMGTLYILDDSFQISEKVEKMSDEEMDRQIVILKKEGRKETENLPDTKPLLANLG